MTTKKGALKILLVLFLMSWGCSSSSGIARIRSRLNAVRNDFEKARSVYSRFRSEYIDKRQRVEDLIEIYYGESREANLSDVGIQDVILRNFDKFTEEERERLREISNNVDEFVLKLERFDRRIQRIDSQLQAGAIDVEQFFAAFDRALAGDGQAINESLTVLGSILVEALKLGNNYMENQ